MTRYPGLYRKLTRPTWIFAAIIAGTILLCFSIRASAGQDTLADQMSTLERLAKYPWWPTKLATPADKFAGSDSCAQCHKDIARSQREAEMARTLIPAEGSEVAAYAGKSVKVDGFTYEFLQERQGLSFRLPSSDTTAKPLTW